MKRYWWFFHLFFLGLCCRGVAVEAQPIEVRPSGFLGWNKETQGQFVTALCADAQGVLWVGTEDFGLWRRETTGAWKQFSSKNGLSDDSVVSLALDRQNRLWVGTARGGVSVWNRERWRTFDVQRGPMAERINDIAVAPQTGEVWIATDAGIARYSEENGWRYLSKLDGMASNQIVALAFDAQGTVFAASACDGLSIGRLGDDYMRWKVVAGAETQPASPQGEGLPSNALNDVAVDSRGDVWVATNYGLARSADQGEHWFFLRGKNWRANVEGSSQGLTPKEVGVTADLLDEDWVTKVEAASDGQIWLGFRQQGFELRDGAQGELVYSWRDARGDNAAEIDFVKTIWPLKNGAIIGSYGTGLRISSSGRNTAPRLENTEQNDIPAPLPSFATAPNAAQLRVWAQRLEALPATEATGGFYGLDRRTQGNWVGRYGDRLARLHAMSSPASLNMVRSPESYKILGFGVGPHGDGNGPYSYLYELKTLNPNSLYNPAVGTRRPGESNDGAFDNVRYPFSWQGPDLWQSVEVPEGTQRIALYFHSYNGHNDINRFRDYIVRLKPYGADLREAEAAPDIARARVSELWNGSYVQFWVNGPGRFRLKIERGASHATIIQATLLDQIRGPQSPSDALPMPQMGGMRYVTEATPAPAEGENETVAAARALWDAAENSATKKGGIEAAWMMRLLAYRAAVAAQAPPPLLDNWRWKLAIWDESDEAGFENTMAIAFKKRELGLQTAQPQLTAPQ